MSNRQAAVFHRLPQFCTAVLIIFVSFFSATKIAAQQSSPLEVISAQSEDSLSRIAGSDSARLKEVRAFDNLISKARENGKVRVIVGINAAFTPEGYLTDAAAETQRDSIKAAQEQLLNQISQFAVTGVKQFEFIPFLAFETDAAAIEFMKNSPDVTFIQEDAVREATLVESTKQIGADTSWTAGLTGTGWAVAILDTGVEKTNSFLSGKVVSEACYSTTATGYTSLCPGGVSSSTASGSGVNCTASVTGCDHGTHVAGIAAGKSPTLSNVAGVAKEGSLIAIQVFSNETSSNTAKSFTSDYILGLQRVYALRSTYNIGAVNMSLGGGVVTSNCDSAEAATKTAIDNLRSVNIATVISSGNGDASGNGYINGISSPACISTAISVGSVRDGGANVASGSVDTVSSFSNSATFLSLLAPGETILSSVPGNGSANKNGTSMAAPHVAGAWAVMRQSMGSGATVQQVLDRLNATGVSITDSRNNITKKRIKLDSAIYVGGNPSLSSYNANPNSSGGNGSFNLTINAGWGWNAVSRASWITTSSGGAGSGTVNYTVAANTTTSPRTGTITIAGQTFTVTQSGVSCVPSLSSSGTSVGGSGGSGSFTVNLPAACTWTANSNNAWLTIGSDGFSTLTYTVAVNNTGSTRTGIITVNTPSSGSASFTVTQSACSSSLSSTTASWGSGSGSTFINVTMPSGCTWSAASSNTSWLTVTSGSSGTGNGQFIYAVAANPNTTSRTATITVTGGSTLTVTQDGVSCSSSLSPSGASPAAAGGGFSFNVTRPAACNTWTAISTVSWITVNSGGSGTTGNGTVNYTVAQNTTGNSRTGTISVSGASTFTVTQNGLSCSSPYFLSPGVTIGAGGGNNIATVVSPDGCNWTATNNAPQWITIASGGSGSGNGSVNLSVAANTTSSQRVGTISLNGGQTYTVTQDGINCTYSISPTSASIGASGGNTSTNVTALSGCAWTASSNAAWISITSGASGSGSGTVNMSVSSNGTTSQRSGTVTIGGQNFTVTQAGQSGCTYSVPASQIVNTDGGYTTIEVTAPAGCAWTAVNMSDWVVITSGGSGTGNGTVNLYYAGNTSPNSRTAEIGIGGQTHSILQYGATCSYSITPNSYALTNAGSTNGYFSMTAPAGCSWSAVSNVPWLSFVFYPSSGSGNGDLYYISTTNTGGRRTGTITIAGLTHTVTQVSATFTANTGMGQNSNFAPTNSNLSLMFSNVSAAGTTTATGLSEGQLQPIPSNFTLPANTPMFDITTTAVYSGGIAVTFNVPNVADAATCSRLRSLHYESGVWRALNNAAPIYNNGTCTVSQTVTSLSPFVVARLTGSPTAANVSVGGRVTIGERGIRNVRVTLTNSAGESRAVMTSTFGYYRFAEVPAGETYVITVFGKKHNFAANTQIRLINEETNDINFVADN